MKVLETIGSVCNMVSGVFGWMAQRMGYKNTPEMQNRAKAQEDNKQNDADAKAIAEKNAEKIRNSLSS